MTLGAAEPGRKRQSRSMPPPVDDTNAIMKTAMMS